MKIISKKFVSEIPDFELTMQKEFKVINLLRHRNIIEFIEMMQSKNSYYYVFELCEGQELKKLIETQKRLSESEA